MPEPISPTRRHLVAIAAAAFGNLLAAASAKADGRRHFRYYHHYRHHEGENRQKKQFAAGDRPYGQCYLRGTHIRTPTGEVPIEELIPGQLVVTANGEAAPIRKVCQLESSDVPVCVRRGALSTGPYADLYVSPAHALFVDGVLIPAIHLVNGVSIRQGLSPDLNQSEYFHLEMEKHELVFAQGVPAETLCKAGMSRCAPLYRYNGGRAELKALLRRLVSRITDVRDPIQVAYDRIVQDITAV
jgi:Hint domain